MRNFPMQQLNIRWAGMIKRFKWALLLVMGCTTEPVVMPCVATINVSQIPPTFVVSGECTERQVTAVGQYGEASEYQMVVTIKRW